VKNYAQTSPFTALLLWLIPFLLFSAVPFFGMNLGKALACSLILLVIAALSDPIGRWLLVLFGLSRH
jgi:hypothetical protein